VAGRPGEPRKPVTQIGKHTLMPSISSDEVVHDAVTEAIRKALQDMLLGVSLMPDERQELAKYRARKQAGLRAARRLVNKAAN
jgi:hypothetical protein